MSVEWIPLSLREAMRLEDVDGIQEWYDRNQRFIHVMQGRIDAAEAQRDALLEAAKAVGAKIVFRTAAGDRCCFFCGAFGDPDDREPIEHGDGCDVPALRDAIAAAEATE